MQQKEDSQVAGAYGPFLRMQMQASELEIVRGSGWVEGGRRRAEGGGRRLGWRKVEEGGEGWRRVEGGGWCRGV